jgi:hypothetical protein
MAGLFDDRSPTISYVCFTLILLKDSDLPTDPDPEDRAMLVETGQGAVHAERKSVSLSARQQSDCVYLVKAMGGTGVSKSQVSRLSRGDRGTG